MRRASMVLCPELPSVRAFASGYTHALETLVQQSASADVAKGAERGGVLLTEHLQWMPYNAEQWTQLHQIADTSNKCLDATDALSRLSASTITSCDVKELGCRSKRCMGL